MSKEEAIGILHEEVDQKKLDRKVVEELVDLVR
jgi:hypothetical protein